MLYFGFYLLFLSQVTLDVPMNYQLPDFPTGCESVATVSAMNYFEEVDINEFISKLNKEEKWREGIFHEAFLGDPRSYSGVMCYEEPIQKVVSEYKNFGYTNLSDKSFIYLLTRVYNGNPVVVWLTIDYVEPKDTGLGYSIPSHTVVISGVDFQKGTVQLTDSLSGVVEKNIGELSDLYVKCGSHAFELYYKGD